MKKVLVIGAGFMGAGIAQVCAQSGFRVFLTDSNQEALEKAVDGIKWSVEKLAKKGFVAEDPEAVLGRLNPEQGILQQETQRVVWEGLNRLTPDTRMVIILRDIQGKSYEEIAEVMELPLGTVKSRVNRGRLQLANILKIFVPMDSPGILSIAVVVQVHGRAPDTVLLKRWDAAIQLISTMQTMVVVVLCG